MTLTMWGRVRIFKGLSRFSKAIVALAVALSIGAQWPVLQSIAWFNMFLTFSAEEGVQQAFVKTFDGQNPCKLCKFVDEGKKAEQGSAKQDTIKKLDPMILANFEIRVDRERPECAPLDLLVYESRLYPPPSPPPDLA